MIHHQPKEDASFLPRYRQQRKSRLGKVEYQYSLLSKRLIVGVKMIILCISQATLSNMENIRNRIGKQVAKRINKVFKVS